MEITDEFPLLTESLYFRLSLDYRQNVINLLLPEVK